MEIDATLKSKYQQLFQHIIDEGSIGPDGLVEMAGDIALVEFLPVPDLAEAQAQAKRIITVGSSHALSDFDAYQARFALVLAVGEGDLDEVPGGLARPPRVQTGNVILLPRHAEMVYTQFGHWLSSTDNTVGIVPRNQAKMSFKNMEAYRKFMDKLNG